VEATLTTALIGAPVVIAAAAFFAVYRLFKRP